MEYVKNRQTRKQIYVSYFGCTNRNMHRIFELRLGSQIQNKGRLFTFHAIFEEKSLNYKIYVLKKIYIM